MQVAAAEAEAAEALLLLLLLLLKWAQHTVTLWPSPHDPTLALNLHSLKLGPPGPWLQCTRRRAPTAPLAPTLPHPLPTKQGPAAGVLPPEGGAGRRVGDRRAPGRV